MKETRNLLTGMCYSLNPEFNVRLTTEIRHNSVFWGVFWWRSFCFCFVGLGFYLFISIFGFVL